MDYPAGRRVYWLEEGDQRHHHPRDGGTNIREEFRQPRHERQTDAHTYTQNGKEDEVDDQRRV